MISMYQISVVDFFSAQIMMLNPFSDPLNLRKFIVPGFGYYIEINYTADKNLGACKQQVINDIQTKL